MASRRKYCKTNPIINQRMEVQTWENSIYICGADIKSETLHYARRSSSARVCIICDKSISLYCARRAKSRTGAVLYLREQGLQDVFPLKSQPAPISALALSFSFHSFCLSLAVILRSGGNLTKFTLGMREERCVSVAAGGASGNKSASNHSGQRGLQTYFPHHIKPGRSFVFCEPQHVLKLVRRRWLVPRPHKQQTEMDAEGDFAFAFRNVEQHVRYQIKRLIFI